MQMSSAAMRSVASPFTLHPLKHRHADTVHTHDTRYMQHIHFGCAASTPPPPRSPVAILAIKRSSGRFLLGEAESSRRSPRQKRGVGGVERENNN